MADTKRMSAQERDGVMRLAVADDAIGLACEDLGERLRGIKYGKRDLGLIRAKIRKIHESVMQTMPEEQHRSYIRTLAMTTYQLGVRGPAGGGKRVDGYGLALEFWVVGALVDACKEKCLVCGLDTEGQRKCELRKALDVIGNDIEDKAGGGCPYQDVIALGEIVREK